MIETEVGCEDPNHKKLSPQVQTALNHIGAAFESLKTTSEILEKELPDAATVGLNMSISSIIRYLQNIVRIINETRPSDRDG